MARGPPTSPPGRPRPLASPSRAPSQLERASFQSGTLIATESVGFRVLSVFLSEALLQS